MDSKVVIYQGKDGGIELNADPAQDTVWATHQQIADVFGIDRSGVTKHINKILDNGEIDEKSNVQKVHIANSDKPVKFYSLDVILSVGYSTNSGHAIKFRRWANTILKGAALNKKRLEQLNKILEVVERSELAEVAGVANLVKNYTKALNIFDEYDRDELKIPKGDKESWQLTYEEARNHLAEVKKIEGFNDNFAVERSGHLEGIINGLYQTFGGEELYSSLQEKAANLLYQVVKDHPFVDGNKRSAAALFVYFLYKNNALKDMNNNTLAAVTLLNVIEPDCTPSNFCTIEVILEIV